MLHMCFCVEKLHTCVVTFIIRADITCDLEVLERQMLDQLQKEQQYVDIIGIGLIFVVMSS